MTTPPGAPERSVVDRTLSILGVFDRDNRTLTLSDISRRAGLPVTTVHRIVNKLHAWGALERGEEGGYGIGLRLWETATLAPRYSSLAEIAEPHLLDLHSQTGGAAVLAIRDGTESVCLSFLTNDLGLKARWGDPGRRLPLHVTAAGLVLLANADVVLQNAVCAGPLRAYAGATITDGTSLRNALSKVRREGYAMVAGTLREGRGAIAAPVRNARGTVVAAVGVVGPLDMLQPSRLAPLVLATAEALSPPDRTEGRWMAGAGA
ncbi:IclR family transcriptional regulator [Streptomyces sp. NRRL WC-3618]|uniref:IclR family transcriptional regulator n=1 Tax=Streptomyces sp. NRRL WC-3618 TaxID=1519490 RepID=UPI0006AEC42C|nr:IclR family transcriptional regulator [Streptomyces sp. NRRL WC-3618]KOV61296.1 IclR family transcriptional regulator [Streptomyces sp. NRRL WC-3618]